MYTQYNLSHARTLSFLAMFRAQRRSPTTPPLIPGFPFIQGQ
jgi:hypothetical protein